MNYQEMSDFEINLAVGKLVLQYEEIKQTPQDGKSLVLWGDGCNWMGFDPCNSWADTGPIAEENLISIEFINGNCMASAKTPNESGLISHCFIEKKKSMSRNLHRIPHDERR